MRICWQVLRTYNENFLLIFERVLSQQYRTYGGGKRSDLVRGLSVQSTAYDQFRRPTKISSLCCKSCSAWESSSLLDDLMVVEVLIKVNFFNWSLNFEGDPCADARSSTKSALPCYYQAQNPSSDFQACNHTWRLIFSNFLIHWSQVSRRRVNSTYEDILTVCVNTWQYVKNPWFVSIDDESDNLITQGLFKFQ